ncbi:hypothetical protein F8388_013916 [Cannabis sativa]|uniref:DUF4283 domain-containing protein n=1 Tax=Cannabis sativa TaxID=3483 RepID=A0A7J6H8J6_CANSA|nr:hypothetical protein F8388_013916 [Cannabis sativa]KAF4391602.1 hypothetical protein G4B88_030753 [Cannabis sativa]
MDRVGGSSTEPALSVSINLGNTEPEPTGVNKVVNTESEIEALRQKFLEDSSLELETDEALTEEVVQKGVLAKCFGRNPMQKSKVWQILSGVWRLRSKWWIKTLEEGLWGIFFDSKEDLEEVLNGRPWLLGGQILNLIEWPEDGGWQKVQMDIARVWVQVHGLPTPYLAWQNAPVVGGEMNLGSSENEEQSEEAAELIDNRGSKDSTTRTSSGGADRGSGSVQRPVDRRMIGTIGTGGLPNSDPRSGDHPIAKIGRNPKDKEPISVEWAEGTSLEEVTRDVLVQSDVVEAQISISLENEGLEAQVCTGSNFKKRKAAHCVIPVDQKGRPLNECGKKDDECGQTPIREGGVFSVGKTDNVGRGSGKSRSNKKNSRGKKKNVEAEGQKKDWFNNNHEVWRLIWDGKMHSRQSLLLWRLCAGVMPTKDKYAGGSSQECVLYGYTCESADHLFMQCPLSRALWLGAPLPVKSDEVSGDMCDTVWNHRNAVIHGVKCVDIPGLLSKEGFPSLEAEIRAIGMVVDVVAQKNWVGAVIISDCQVAVNAFAKRRKSSRKKLLQEDDESFDFLDMRFPNFKIGDGKAIDCFSVAVTYVERLRILAYLCGYQWLHSG